jgi:hypothetical protein
MAQSQPVLVARQETEKSNYSGLVWISVVSNSKSLRLKGLMPSWSFT